MFSQTICSQKEACGCEVDFACASVFKPTFAAIVQFAADNGLVYDEVCARTQLGAYVSARGCETAAEGAVFSFCPDTCVTFHGDAMLGEKCVEASDAASALFVRDCVEGLYCYEGTCSDSSGLKILQGNACFDPMVGQLGFCEDGSACDYSDSHTCEPEVPEGSDCTTPAVKCDFSTFCSGEGVCTAPQAVGAACMNLFECASLYCTDGACGDYVWICELDAVDELHGIAK